MATTIWVCGEEALITESIIDNKAFNINQVTEMLDRVLLFLWFPLSSGLFKGLNEFVVGGMTRQHIIMLLFPIYSLASAFHTKKFIQSTSFKILIGYMVLHTLVFNVTVDAAVRLFVYWGVVQWAFHIARRLSFADFVTTVAFSAAVFFILSILFAIVFRDVSFEYLQGRMVMNSFFGQKNVYSRFLQICLMIFTVASFMEGGVRRYVYVLLAAMGFALLLMYTESRTSLVVSVLCFVIFCVVRFGALRGKQIFIGICLLALLFVWAIKTDNIYAYRIGSMRDGINVFGYDVNLTGRLTIWDAMSSILTLEDKWLFGYGYGGFSGITSQGVLTNIGLGDFIPNDSHNGYLDTVINFGLVGAVGIITIIGINFCRRREASTSEQKLQLAFILSMLVGYVFSNLTESYLVKSTSIYGFFFWVVYFERWSDAKFKSTNVARFRKIKFKFS